MTDPVTKVLIEARRLLRERGWCQGAMARDASGVEVPFASPRAATYCLHGALAAASSDGDAHSRSIESLRPIVGGSGGLIAWNDAPGRTFEEVDAALTAAIEGGDHGDR